MRKMSMPTVGRLGHERGGDLGRVRRVADRVAPAQQHLQAEPRHVVAQHRQPLPRVLLQEAQRDVVGGPAPALDATAARAVVRPTYGATRSRSLVRTRVASSDWCASRKVVSVTSTPVRERRSAAKPSGPSSSSRCREPCGEGFAEVDAGGQLVPRVEQGRRVAVRLVDRDLGQPAQQPGAAVGGHVGGQQLGSLLDERGRHVAGDEVRVGQHGLQERDVGADARGSGTRPAPGGPGPRRRRSRGRGRSA